MCLSIIILTQQLKVHPGTQHTQELCTKKCILGIFGLWNSWAKLHWWSRANIWVYVEDKLKCAEYVVKMPWENFETLSASAYLMVNGE